MRCDYGCTDRGWNVPVAKTVAAWNITREARTLRRGVKLHLCLSHRRLLRIKSRMVLPRNGPVRIGDAHTVRHIIAATLQHSPTCVTAITAHDNCSAR